MAVDRIGVDEQEVKGVELSKAEEIMRRRINESHMVNGVTIIDVNSTYIEADVEIGNDTIVYPGAMLNGNTKIGTNCVIGMNCSITNSQIGNDTEVIKMEKSHYTKQMKILNN